LGFQVFREVFMSAYECLLSSPDPGSLSSVSFFEGSGGRPREYAAWLNVRPAADEAWSAADLRPRRAAAVDTDTAGRRKHAYKEPRPLSDKHRLMLEQGGKYSWKGVRFASAAEAACAELLELYIPGFKIVPGKTFQLIVADREKGTAKTVDFLVNDVLVEFHPPNHYPKRNLPQGDFTDQDLPAGLIERPCRLDASFEERAVLEARDKQAAHGYQRLRRQVVATDPRFRGTRLIVVVSAGDLYDKIIDHYGRGCPDRERFIRQFEKVMAEVLKENGAERPRRRAGR
jgi:hypothetical protein